MRCIGKGDLDFNFGSTFWEFQGLRLRNRDWELVYFGTYTLGMLFDWLGGISYWKGHIISAEKPDPVP